MFERPAVEYHAVRQAEDEDLKVLRRYGQLAEQKKLIEQEMSSLRDDVANTLAREEDPNIDIGDYLFEFKRIRQYSDERLNVPHVIWLTPDEQVCVTERQLKEALKHVSQLNKRDEYLAESRYSITAKPKWK